MLELCKEAPGPGTPVGVIHRRRGACWIERRTTVKAIIDQGPSSRGIIAILEDGTWEFYWNLTKLETPCKP